MTKPVFLWWAHKELWNTIAKYPGIRKKIAFRYLQKKYGKKIFRKRPFAYCFACGSAQTYIGNDSHRYRCEYCPLDWGEHGTCTEEDDSLYLRWKIAAHAKDHISVVNYASIIHDLPLRENVHELYNVKESPNE